MLCHRHVGVPRHLDMDREDLAVRSTIHEKRRSTVLNQLSTSHTGPNPNPELLGAKPGEVIACTCRST